MYRRLRQVEKTHSGMLPQSRTLEGGDHAVQRQRHEGFLPMRNNMEPVADIPEGRPLNHLSGVTRSVRTSCSRQERQ